MDDALHNGGFIPDSKGMDCRSGGRVVLCAGSAGQLLGRVMFDRKDFRWRFIDDDGRDYNLSSDMEFYRED